MVIGATDIYITPYLNPRQITSGTLAYTVGAGKAVISEGEEGAEAYIVARGELEVRRTTGDDDRRDDAARHQQLVPADLHADLAAEAPLGLVLALVDEDTDLRAAIDPDEPVLYDLVAAHTSPLFLMQRLDRYYPGEDGALNLLFWQAVSTLNPYLSQGTKDVTAASMVLEPLARR